MPDTQPQNQPLSRKDRRAAERATQASQAATAKRNELMKKILLALGLLAIVGAIIVFAVISREDPSQVGNLSLDPGAGPETAAVTVTEYGDFQCPACAGVAPVVHDLIDQYGDQIRYEWNDFPLPQHQHGTNAAIGAECAFAQGKFFEYHDLAFDRQAEWSPKSEDEALDAFTAIAEEIGLDMAAFDACVTDQATADRVNEDISEGRALNVNATPTFFVNGVRVVGAPYSVNLKKEIDAALAAQPAQTPEPAAETEPAGGTTETTADEQAESEPDDANVDSAGDAAPAAE
jgi:protein-disulfide isomerase